MKELERLVALACAEGATEAEITRSRSHRKTVFFEKNALKSLKSDSGAQYGIRVIAGTRAGYVSSNDAASIRDSVKEAVSIARASEEDPYNGLPAPEDVTMVDGLSDSGEPSLAEIEEAARSLVETARAYDSRVSVDSASVEFRRSAVNILSSKGVSLSQERSSVFYFIMGMAIEGSDISSFDYTGDAGVGWRKTVGGVKDHALRFGRAVVESLGAKPVARCRGYALMSPDTVEEMLSTLDFLLSAKNVQERRSSFAGKLGRPVASEVLTLKDEPRIPGLPWSASFDGEGVPTRALALIEAGVLKSYLHDTYTARKDKVRSTGHASGGGTSNPSLHAPILAPTADLAAMQGMMDKGVSVRRFSGNINPVSGVFSGVVKGGRYIERGKIVHPVTGTMLSGTFESILANIVAVSKETEPTFIGALPYVLVKDMDIVGETGS